MYIDATPDAPAGADDGAAPARPSSARATLLADLAPAPALTRGAARVRRPRRRAAAVLAAFGALVLAAVVGSGLFSTIAGGQQLLDEFAPHLSPDSLARYDADLVTLRAGAASAGREDALTERLPGVAAWVEQADAVDARAQGLLDRVRAAGPDYRAAAAIDGFDRVPLLLASLGLAAVVAGVVLALGSEGRRTPAVVTLVLAAAVAIYPAGSGLWGGADRTERLVTSLQPVMSRAQVVALQRDFVIVVQAVGELDATFRTAGVDLPPEVAALVRSWPQISSDLADLVGTINDNLARYDALRALPNLALVPWGLLALGLGAAALTATALPRRQRP